MAEQKQSDIDELAKLLKLRKATEHPTVLLLGSRAGELFRSKHLYENLQNFSHRDFSKLSRAEWFSECYSILTRNQFSETDIHGILRTALRDLTVTKADACLAEMVKQGHFDEIISTNIDDVLEQSFLTVEMKEHRDFEVTIPVRETLRDKSLPHRIVKVYGDFGSQRYTIKERLLHLERHPEIKSALQRLLARDIVVVGIDPIWDEGIIAAIPAASGSIFFVNEEELEKHSISYSISKERKAHYIRGSYDYFMRELYNYLYGGLGLPINYQLAENILAHLSQLSHQLEMLQATQDFILNELKNKPDRSSKGDQPDMP